MLFTNPYFLFGLFAIAIPIVIHLFNFRRFKKIYFSDTSFLEELKVQTQKYSRLKHLLILLLRILAITAMVFAFAQPFIPIAGTQNTIKAKNAVSIFVDNSFSMQSVTDQNRLLDIAKNKAKEIISAYSNSDEFQLLTHDFEGKHQHLCSKDEFLKLIDEVEITASVRKLPEIIKRQQDALSQSPQANKISYIISDFQKSISNFESIKSDSNFTAFLIPLIPQKTNNIFIDSCWFDSPVLQINKTVKLNVKIINSSETAFDKVPVKLMINGKQRAVASIDIKEKEEQILKLSYTITESGIQSGIIEITDYPIIYDDKYFFSYNVAVNIPIMIINGNEENQYLNKLYKLDSVFSVNNFNDKNIDFSIFNNQDFIILNNLKTISSGLIQELKRFADNGGSIAIFPASEIDFDSYKLLSTTLNIDIYEQKDSTDTKVEELNMQHPVYRDVFEKLPENIDLPSVFSFYSFNKNQLSRKEYLLKLLNGKDFLTSSISGKGIVYQSSVPLETNWSNFPRHAIFVPTLFNMAMQSQQGNKLSYTIGNDEVIRIKSINLNGEETMLLKGEQKGFEIIPEHKNIDNQLDISFHNQIKQAGNYHLYKGNQQITDISFNYDRNESRLDFFTSDDIQKIIKDNSLSNYKLIETKNKNLGELIKEINQGIKLWKLFIILTLVFLLAEAIIIRFWR